MQRPLARTKGKCSAEYIIMEIQREKVHRQDMRFRKYLGKMLTYQSRVFSNRGP